MSSDFDDATLLALQRDAEALDAEIRKFEIAFQGGAGVGPKLNACRERRETVRNATLARQQELALERQAAAERAQAEAARVTAETLATNERMAKASEEAARYSAESAVASRESALAAKSGARWTFVAAVVAAFAVAIQASQAWSSTHGPAPRPAVTARP